MTLPDLIAGPLQKIEAPLNAVIDFLIAWIADIGGPRPETSEAMDAVLGYLAGLWDGIADAVTGIFDMIALAGDLLARWLRANKNLDRALDLMLETVDEIVGALGRIDWLRLWDWTVTNAPSLWEAAYRRASNFFDGIVTHTARAGYYFGYLVYMVIEFFLPPIKLSTIIQNARRLHSAAFFAKVF